jgi:4-hydroxyacetophenone monooxygenase
MNDMMRAMFTQYMWQVAGDETLLAKVTPTYPPFVKRMLQDNGSWLQALTRENVDLVTDRIAEIGPRGIRCEDGTEHEVDDRPRPASREPFLWPMDVWPRGRAVRALGRRARAYLGITVPGFPNFFCLTGGTNPHTRQHHLPLGCQVRYVMAARRAPA